MARTRTIASAVFLTALSVATPSVPTRAAEDSQLPIVGSGTFSRPSSSETASSRVKATLGRGLNGFTGALRGDCIEYTASIPSGFSGFGTRTDIKLIQSTEEFQREIGVSVSGSGGIGKLSIEASAKYDNSVKISGSSDYLMVRVKVDGPTIAMDTQALTPFATKYRENKQSFFVACGNQYVSEVQLGGDFIAILEFTASSETERTQVQANLRAATAVSSVNAEFKMSVERAQKQSSMRSTVIRHGTDETLPDFSLDQLVQYARAFPSKVNDKTAVPIGVTLSDYQMVDPDLETIDTPPLVQRLRERVSAAQIVMDRIDPLIIAQEKLGLPGRLAELQAIRTSLPDKMQVVIDALEVCGKQPWKSTNCAFSSDVQSFAVPKLPGHPIVTPFTSRHGSKQLIGLVRAGEERIMLVRGQFDYNNENQWIDVSRVTSVTFERPDGTTTPAVAFQPPVKFTGPGTVYVFVADTKYDDNRDDGNIRAILY